MFNNLRDAKAQIEKLGTEALALTKRAEAAESSVTTITSRAEIAESEVKTLTTDLESVRNEVKVLTDRAEKAESSLKESEAKQSDFDAKVKDAATKMATSQLAATGHKPVEGDDSSSSGGAPGNSMTEDQFWSQYRSLKPSAKAKWYEENKSKIGR